MCVSVCAPSVVRTTTEVVCSVDVCLCVRASVCLCVCVCVGVCLPVSVCMKHLLEAWPSEWLSGQVGGELWLSNIVILLTCLSLFCVSTMMRRR